MAGKKSGEKELYWQDGKHSPKLWRCRRREELISGSKR